MSNSWPFFGFFDVIFLVFGRRRRICENVCLSCGNRENISNCYHPRCSFCCVNICRCGDVITKSKYFERYCKCIDKHKVLSVCSKCAFEIVS